MTIKQTFQEKFIAYAKKGLVGIIVLGICGFVGMKIYPLVHGPMINMTSISNGISVTDPMIRISGVAEHTQELVVNGNTIPLSPNGSFSDNLVLNQGYNIISMQAKDQFGKISSRDYAIVLKETPSSLSLNKVFPY